LEGLASQLDHVRGVLSLTAAELSPADQALLHEILVHPVTGLGGLRDYVFQIDTALEMLRRHTESARWVDLLAVTSRSLRTLVLERDSILQRVLIRLHKLSVADLMLELEEAWTETSGVAGPVFERRSLNQHLSTRHVFCAPSVARRFVRHVVHNLQTHAFPASQQLTDAGGLVTIAATSPSSDRVQFAVLNNGLPLSAARSPSAETTTLQRDVSAFGGTLDTAYTTDSGLVATRLTLLLW
jgi:hypothetical protein